ncbi:hypothetical protein BLEM_1766 [Bifidobacterium lemurum]|uniref:Uncharacterized protein n=1 Tax=Bifidobacterium lemurum TaxID=1603886 RepID=A0A261FN15_9BIFI|nr:hypothetical protein [Bifidobacterium lemurum]OZG60570.1 hypothetical protein BLEM_1766 [Bifidobacterium lemurum]QOL34207.1 hypothetical protein BL8807_10885 [Bifidobacterium lemurum]
MFITWSMVIITAAVAMYACFLLIKRRDRQPAINSYMPLSAIVAGQSSGFFRQIVLRFTPIIIILIAELAVLSEMKVDFAAKMMALFMSTLLFSIATYGVSAAKAFGFGERLLNISVILLNCILSVALGITSLSFDYSCLAPSNFSSMIDSLWSSLSVALVIIVFFELLRNDPEEKQTESNALQGRKETLIIRSFSQQVQRYISVIKQESQKQSASPSLLTSILIYEDLNRPKWIRTVENLLVAIPGTKLTVGIAQVESTVPLSDEESISNAAQRLFNTQQEDISQMVGAVIKYNQSEQYVGAVMEIFSVLKRYNLLQENSQNQTS